MSGSRSLCCFMRMPEKGVLTLCSTSAYPNVLETTISSGHGFEFVRCSYSECGFLPPGSFFETALLETVKIKKLLAVIWIRNIRLLCLNTWSLVGVGRLWNLKEMHAPLLEELCLWGDL